MKRPRFRSTVSQRGVRNVMTFWAGGTEMEAPNKERSKTPRKQAESAVNKIAQKEARLAFNAELYRNRRGMAQLPGGGMMPFGVGPDGTGDTLGFTPIRITAAMVGAVLPIYTETEQKIKAGIVADHQQARIEYLRDRNAICGVVREAGDFSVLVNNWLARWMP